MQPTCCAGGIALGAQSPLCLPPHQECSQDAAHIASLTSSAFCPVWLRRSLLIIDEFGKGTLAADGVGLLCATLRHLASLPAPPRVVLCTHYRWTEGRAAAVAGQAWRAALQ